ncbi:hypothetical protein ACP70R_023398 [Stipagrostis hirtigluma subsp. patula]
MASPDHRPTAAATIDGRVLTVEQIEDVLVRLPAKSLCPLRAVCRSWKSLISDPAFVAASPRVPAPVPARHHGCRPRQLASRDGGRARGGRVVWPRPPAGAGGVVVRSRHDAHAPPPDVHRRGEQVPPPPRGRHVLRHRLLRPRPLPRRPPAPEPGRARRGSQLGRQVRVFVIGRAASGKHKALRIRNDLPGGQVCQVLAIDSRRNSPTLWWHCQSPSTAVLSGHRHTAVVQGIAHFLVDPWRRGRPPFGYKLRDFAAGGIASFNLATEQWSPTLLSGPPSSSTSTQISSFCRKSEVHLAVLNGRLVVVHHDDDARSLDLWFRVDESTLVDGQAVWCRRYAIQYGSIMTRYDREVEPLWEMADGRVALWVWGHDMTQMQDGSRRGRGS